MVEFLKNLADFEKAGELLAQSRICGAINPPAGAVILMMCAESGTSLEKFLQRYHVIPTQTKTEISRKSETMVADFLEAGGQMEVISRTPERCAAKFTFKTASYLSDLTWETIKDESYTKERDRRSYKENWSTPRRRMQMMWARCISDGIRTVCPAATAGQYTVEEVQDFDGAEKPAAPATPAAPAAPVAEPMVTPMPMPPATEPEPMPMPTPVAPPQPAPEAPFSMKGPDDLDYTICRCPGQYQNVKWALVPPDMLRMALEITAPNLYEQDRGEIRRILLSKQQ